MDLAARKIPDAHTLPMLTGFVTSKKVRICGKLNGPAPFAALWSAAKEFKDNVKEIQIKSNERNCQTRKSSMC